MSLKIMAAVWEDRDTSGSLKLVQLALADNANDEGYCWPSLETIATKCNLKRRYVIDLVAKLEGMGKIEREQRTEKGMYTSTLYRVVVRRDALPSEAERTRVVRPDALPSEAENTTVVSGDALPSEAGNTTGSEAERTRVVRPTSLKPSINRNSEPSENREGEPRPPDPPPDITQELSETVERKTGMIFKHPDRWIPAINRMAAAGVTVHDLEAAIDEMIADGLSYSGPWSFENAAIVALNRRKAAGNGQLAGRQKADPAKEAIQRARERLKAREHGDG